MTALLDEPAIAASRNRASSTAFLIQTTPLSKVARRREYCHTQVRPRNQARQRA